MRAPEALACKPQNLAVVYDAQITILRQPLASREQRVHFGYRLANAELPVCLSEHVEVDGSPVVIRHFSNSRANSSIFRCC